MSVAQDPPGWTGLCTACGDQWQEDEKPSVCPECGFTGVVAVRSNPADD